VVCRGSLCRELNAASVKVDRPVTYLGDVLKLRSLRSSTTLWVERSVRTLCGSVAQQEVTAKTMEIYSLSKKGSSVRS